MKKFNLSTLIYILIALIYTGVVSYLMMGRILIANFMVVIYQAVLIILILFFIYLIEKSVKSIKNKNNKFEKVMSYIVLISSILFLVFGALGILYYSLNKGCSSLGTDQEIKILRQLHLCYTHYEPGMMYLKESTYPIFNKLPSWSVFGAIGIGIISFFTSILANIILSIVNKVKRK